MCPSTAMPSKGWGGGGGRCKDSFPRKQARRYIVYRNFNIIEPI
jgi:hypothetical protein